MRRLTLASFRRETRPPANHAAIVRSFQPGKLSEGVSAPQGRTLDRHCLLSDQRLRRRNKIACLVLSSVLWLSYLGILGSHLFPANGEISHYAARVVLQAAGVLLIGAGLWAFLQKRKWLGRGRGIVVLIATLGVAISIHGALVYGEYNRALRFGLLPWVSVMGVYAAASPGAFHAVKEALRRMAWISCPLVAYVLLVHLPSRADFSNLDSPDPSRLTLRLCVLGLPLLSCLPSLTWTSRVVVVAIAAEYFAVTVALALRGAFLTGFLLAALVVFTADASQRFKMAFLVGAGGITIAVFGFWFVGGRGAAPEAGITLEGRFGVDSSDGVGEMISKAWTTSSTEFVGDSSRGGEARAFLDQAHLLDFVYGRGAGASWVSPFSAQWYIVHIGPLYLILLGGLPLLFAFVILVVSALRAAFRAARWSYQARLAIIFITIFVFGFLQHGPITDEPETYLFWICIGLALSSRRAVRVRLIPSWKSLNNDANATRTAGCTHG
jgi:hypothetical protein